MAPSTTSLALVLNMIMNLVVLFTALAVVLLAMSTGTALVIDLLAAYQRLFPEVFFINHT